MPATTPTRLTINNVVGGIRSDVHLNTYSSPKFSSSPDFEVTVKFVSIPANTFKRPWKSANRCAETPPITQNCSFLHHSSTPTPAQRISRIPVAKMEMKREMNHKLARLLICKSEKQQHQYLFIFLSPNASVNLLFLSSPILASIINFQESRSLTTCMNTPSIVN